MKAYRRIEEFGVRQLGILEISSFSEKDDSKPNLWLFRSTSSTICRLILLCLRNGDVPRLVRDENSPLFLELAFPPRRRSPSNTSSSPNLTTSSQSFLLQHSKRYSYHHHLYSNLPSCINSLHLPFSPVNLHTHKFNAAAIINAHIVFFTTIIICLIFATSFA